MMKKLLKKYLLELLSFDTEVQRMVKQIALIKVHVRNAMLNLENALEEK
jgi:hypothetical protein